MCNKRGDRLEDESTSIMKLGGGEYGWGMSSECRKEDTFMLP